MAAVAPLVVPGVTMAELAEAVEHELLAAGSRTTSFTTHIFTGLGEGELDSHTETAHEPMPEGTSVMFDFGGVVDGYCSDFGRTIYCGDPPDDYREVYEIMLAAQEAGRAAAAAGTVAAEVNAACRRPIEEAGLGEHFRHRMGHGIGMDVHERPFISEEDQTPLEPGMTFTDEPSIIIPGRFSVRIEDIVVVRGGRRAQAQQLSHRPRRERLNYLGDTCVTSTWYCALKNAFLRSFVDTKTCVGCRSGKNGPRCVQPPLDLPVERLARLRRRCDARLCGKPLDGRVGALRPARAQPDQLARRERQVVGRIRVVGAPKREPERHLPVAVLLQPRADSGAGELDMEAGRLQVRLDPLRE